MSARKPVVTLKDRLGSIAEDKDFARAVRTDVLLPALEQHRDVCLDFTGIRVATQSFVHACISQGIRKYGASGLALLEFRGCSSAVKTVIQTVVSYSLEFAADEVAVQLSTSEIPQADDLTKVRTVLAAIARGATSSRAASLATGYTERHVAYRAATARALRWLEPVGPLRLTPAGRALLSTRPDSAAEREAMHAAVESSQVFCHIVPDLFDDSPPSLDAIRDRIVEVASLAPSTAARRAQTLLSWRRQLLSDQFPLPLSE